MEIKGFIFGIFNADKTPPHLGFTINGKCFSLSHSKMGCGIDASILHRTIESKQIPTLFVEIIQSKESDIQSNIEITTSIFGEYKDLSKTKETCITPLKKSLEQIINFTLADCNVIFDVFNRCKEYDCELKYHQMHLDYMVMAGEFKMEHYSIKEVKDRIDKLIN